MAKIITTDGNILSDGFPQIQIGDRLFRVDNRKSTYDKIAKEIEANTKKEPDKRKTEEKIIMELTLGKEATKDVEEMDLSVNGYINLVIYIQAAIFDTSFEDAKARFQKEGI